MDKPLRSEFSKNVITLITGTTFSQIIPLCAMPILSRLFTPEEFGVYGFYFSIITILVVFSTGRYEFAIPLPKEKKDAWHILVLSILILCIFCLMLALIIAFSNNQIIGFLNKPAIGKLFYLVPVFVFLTGLYNILTMWMHRQKMFVTTSFSKIHNNLWEQLVSIFLGFKKNNINLKTFSTKFSSFFSNSNLVISANNIGFSGLLIGRFFGLLVSNFYLLFKFKKQEKTLIYKTEKLELKKVALLYKDFPIINMFHALSDELKTSGLSFVILYFFMDRSLGIYNQTYKLLRAPLGVIGSAFGHVFFQKAAEMNYNNLPIKALVFKTIKKLFWIALPIFSLIFAFSPWFFTFFLGEKWSDVGIYAQYMTPWLFVNFIFSPISQVGIIVGKQFQFWMINLISSILVFLSMIIAGLYIKDIKSGLLIISITQVIFSIYLYKWLNKIIDEHDQKNIAT